jgi:formylglycine-generating enzyme required for sulfatase activity
MIVRILLILSLIIVCSCGEDTIVNPPTTLYSELRLTPGIEGSTRDVYTFTVVTSPTNSEFVYQWRLDTNEQYIEIPTNTVSIQFPKEGYYFVAVRVLHKGTIVAVNSTTVNIRDSVEVPEFVSIPQGSFVMGSNDPFDFNELPQRLVNLSAFSVAKYEITQKQFVSLMGYNPSWFNRGGQLPVERVQWYEAIEYCNRLSVRQGLNPVYRVLGDSVIFARNANGFRLLTDAEWEYACRAGTNTDTYNGNLKDRRTFCNNVIPEPEQTLDEIAWYCSNSQLSTHEVGLKKPNSFGLFDMQGNVSEWVWDYHDIEYYKKNENINPTGPVWNVERKRVTRGGSWELGTIQNRSHSRFDSFPKVTSYSFGFRIGRNG